MAIREVQDGLWSFTVNTDPTQSGYIWARPLGTSGAKTETFASKSSTALPWETDTTVTYEGTASFANKTAFLEWVCDQVGGGTLYVWDAVFDPTSSTFNCPSEKR